MPARFVSVSPSLACNDSNFTAQMFRVYLHSGYMSCLNELASLWTTTAKKKMAHTQLASTTMFANICYIAVKGSFWIWGL